MTRELSVLVETRQLEDLSRFIAALDGQTRSTGSFDVTFIDRGLSPAERDGLSRLRQRRPSVAVLRADELREAQLADRVLLVDTEQLLFPEALDRLAAFGREHVLNVVSGRVTRPKQPTSWPFLSDEPTPTPAAREAALQAPVLLVDRGLLRFDTDRIAVDSTGAHVGVLAGYPAAQELRAATAEGALTTSIHTSRLQWVGSEIEVEVGGSASAASSDLSLSLVVRQVGTRLTVLLGPNRAATGAEPGPDTTAWRTTFRFDPRTVATGAALSPGLWEPELVVTDGSASSLCQLLHADPLPPSGILAGMPIVFAAGSGGTVQFDVGATRHPVIVDADPHDADVVESVAGSVLTLRLPGITAIDESVVPGSVALGTLRFPAHIEVRDGAAALIAHLSGLPGVVPLSTAFGRSQLHPTGLSVDFAADGQMRVIATPPASDPRADSAAEPPIPLEPSGPRPERNVPPAATGPVAKLRRSLPTPLEPIARRLRHNAVARSLYRRLTGLHH